MSIEDYVFPKIDHELLGKFIMKHGLEKGFAKYVGGSDCIFAEFVAAAEKELFKGEGRLQLLKYMIWYTLQEERGLEPSEHVEELYQPIASLIEKTRTEGVE